MEKNGLRIFLGEMDVNRSATEISIHLRQEMFIALAANMVSRCCWTPNPVRSSHREIWDMLGVVHPAGSRSATSALLAWLRHRLLLGSSSSSNVTCQQAVHLAVTKGEMYGRAKSFTSAERPPRNCCPSPL